MNFECAIGGHDSIRFGRTATPAQLRLKTQRQLKCFQEKLGAKLVVRDALAPYLQTYIKMRSAQRSMDDGVEFLLAEVPEPKSRAPPPPPPPPPLPPPPAAAAAAAAGAAPARKLTSIIHLHTTASYAYM